MGSCVSVENMNPRNKMLSVLNEPKLINIDFPMLRKVAWASAFAILIRMLCWSSLAIPKPSKTTNTKARQNTNYSYVP